MERIHSFALYTVLGLFVCAAAQAGAPEGHPSSIDPTVLKPVNAALEERGYVARDPKETFKPAVGAFLWDNRHNLVSIDIPKEREVDLVICLLGVREGDRRIRQIGGPAVGPWCEAQLKKVPSN